MKTVPADIQTGLNDGTIATCVQLTTKSGEVFGFTNHDTAITVSGTVFKATPGLSDVKMNIRDNAEVSNQEVSGGWVVDLDEQELQSGKFDNAEFEVFIVNWAAIVGGVLDTVNNKLIKLKGNTGILQWSEDGFRVDIHNMMKRLGKSMGFTSTANCRHKLFSQFDDTLVGACTLNPVTYTVTGTVTAEVASKLKFTASGITQASGYYTGGTVTFTSGLNNGNSYTVKSYDGTNVTLYLPSGYSIQVGDTFEITAGCDKTFTTCKNKFNNEINFGGFPHIKGEINYK